MRNRLTPHSARSAALLLSFATTAYAQLPSAEIIAVGDVFTTTPGVLRNFIELSAGADTGWIASAFVIDAAGAPESVLYGEFSASDPSGPRILRRPESLAGVDQNRIFAPSLAAGQVAYLSQTTTAASSRAAWLEDQLIARVGAPAGNSSQTWGEILRVINTVSGNVVVEGSLNSPGPGLRAWIEYPSGDVILQQGQMVAGTSETIQQVRDFDLSADGQNHVAYVTLAPSGDEAILLNGALYVFPNGSLARSGDLVGFGIVQVSHVGLTWEGFDSPQVNSFGDIVFTADYGHGSPQFTSDIRNGRLLPDAAPAVAPLGATEMDERGFVLNLNPFDTLPASTFERERLAFSSFEVDFDGDGLADPGYRITPAISWDGDTVMNGAGGIYGGAGLRVPGSSDVFQAIFRSTFVQEGSQYCPGENNSTGRPARLAAAGSDVSAFNRMKIVATGLPSGSITLPLFSLTPGAGVQPPGSSGTLCLAGQIGRGYFSQINGGSFGTGSADIYLNALPQPNGLRAVVPGETWYAQLWYRDAVGTMATSSFSDAITIEFR